MRVVCCLRLYSVCWGSKLGVICDGLSEGCTDYIAGARGTTLYVLEAVKKVL